ncbi:TonB-dependent receptor [Luteimonas huabeiensis]|uniref:TonB-dependent receptor n=1 Tax=Luteimonas huabeiensis TaxID=1244513 RepID=UPI00046662B9|nr:TonB-dependent receptor [Luteimonas huabeiensis]
MPFRPRRLPASIRSALLAACAAAAAAPAGAFAQDAAATAQELDTVVVTGRAGAGLRTKAETSYSITNIEEEALRLQAPTSVTEAMKSVPGFWVESSGGEASGNIRARGVPVDGYGSVQLLEDGIPVQHDPALGYLNADQAFRLDETIERIEVVRGGPSSVFYSNAPAGAINFIPRTVGETAEGLLKLTVGDHGLFRTDFWYGAPAGDWTLGVGGFYRSHDGVRDPGFTANQGGQLRLSLGRAFERGRVAFDLKRLDDTVAFYTGIPMRTGADGEIRAVPGFDGHHGTLAGPETSLLRLTTGDGGDYVFDNTRGTEVERTQLTGRFEFDLGAGWQLRDTLRYSDTTTQRNGVYPNVLRSAASFLEETAGLAAGIPGAAGLQLRYATSPDQVFDVADQNGNGLMVLGGLRGITMPVTEVMNDLQLSRAFEAGGQRHDLTFGYYYAHLEEDFDRYSSNALLDVRDKARLLDLVAVDAAGNVLATITDHGIWRHGYEWERASGEQTTHAFYLADEWQVAERLRLDAGLRWEKMTARGRVERKTQVDLGTPATSQIWTGTGEFAHYDDSFDKLGWTVGANWQFAGQSGLFARYTAASRLPGLGSYITNAAATPDIQTMDLAEVGYKFGSPAFDFYATAFWTKYDNVGFSNYRVGLDGVVVNEARYADTRTLGLELEGSWRPSAWFDLSATATVQDPEYRGLRYTDSAGVEHDYDGHQLIRVPKHSVRLVPGLNLADGRLRLQAAYERQGSRYVDTANSVRLPSYDALNLSARFEVDERLSVYAYVDNATNSLGLTEGNPRAGELSSGDAGANTFIARPLLGRSYRLALTYRF